MAASIVGLGSRSYRSGGGTGVRSRFRLGSTRGLSVVQSAASSSLAQWASEQHAELLAARDMEALNKLAAGGTDDFIQYAMERIAALSDGTTKEHWQNLLAQAQERSGIQKVNNTVKQYAAMLQSGEMAGQAFLDYLQGQLGNFAPGSDEYTYLVQNIGDAKKWIDLSVRALEKRHDEEMAAHVAEQGYSKEALTEALDYYKGRRAQLKPGDEAFGSLSKTIADLQNSIQATEFNDQVNAAHAKLIEESATDSIGAKNNYLASLVKLMNSARDPAAQQKLFEQVQAVRDSIKKDEILKDAQQTNVKMVSYFGDDPNTNATTILQFLAQKAAQATDPAEAARYTSLAAQVVAHERQKSQDAIAAAQRASSASGGAGPGFSTEVINRALNPYEDAYKDALDTVNRKLDRGITPTQADWAILYETRSNYQNVIGQAYTQANATAKGTLDNTDRTVRDESGSGTGWDFGKVGDKMAAKIVNDIKLATDDVARIKGDQPELQAKAIAKQLADIMKAKTSPFLQIAKDEAVKLDEMAQKLDAQVAATIGDATNTILGYKKGLAMGDISSKYDAYTGKLSFDEWYNALTTADSAKSFAQAIGSPVTGPQWSALQKLVADDKAQQDSAMTSLIAATQFRLPNGEIDPAWQSGGRLDESTRAANIQKILDGASAGSTLITPGDQFAGQPSQGMPNTGAPGGLAGQAWGGLSPQGFWDQPSGKRGLPALAVPQTDVVPQDQQMVVPGTDVLNAQFKPPDATSGQPIDASIPQSAEPDPWAAGGFLDESTRAALRASGFGAPDPHTAAWEFLNTPAEFMLPTFTLPDLPPEPSFMPVDFGIDYGTFGGNSLTSGPLDSGSNWSPAPPPATSFQIPDSYGGGASGGGEGASGPTFQQ